MAFTTYFQLSKPPYQTLRYDEELNSNMDLLEAIALGFPGATPPGSIDNWPDVVVTQGMSWLDSVNHQLKVYYNSSWQIVKQFT